MLIINFQHFNFLYYVHCATANFFVIQMSVSCVFFEGLLNLTQEFLLFCFLLFYPAQRHSVMTVTLYLYDGIKATESNSHTPFKSKMT